MRVLLAAHGYPPELVGGTENSVRALAHSLAAAGHEPVVFAGSMDYGAAPRRSLGEDRDPASGRAFAVHRTHRSDLHFDHWQKGASAAAGGHFEELLDALRPDLVHVHHWIRTSDDLVLRAAVHGVPAVVTLHDHWSTCLVSFRVRPDTRRPCSVPQAPDPCLACAAGVPPRTPWRSADELASALEERRATLVGELALARALLVPSAAHGRAVLAHLGAAAGAAELQVVPPARSTPPARGAGAQDPAPLPPAGAAFTAERPLVLAAFGLWSDLKGTDLLVDALAALAPGDRARLRLELAGDAPEPGYRERLEQRARAAGVAERIGWGGAYRAEDLALGPVGRAHLFVTTTRAAESFGLVVDEALELGLGCLLVARGALAERAAAPWARAFGGGEADTVAALAGLLCELLEDSAAVHALRAAAARALAEDDRTHRAVTPAVHLERTLAAYAGATAAGPPDPGLDRAGLVARDRGLAAAEAAWDAALSVTPRAEAYP